MCSTSEDILDGGVGLGGCGSESLRRDVGEHRLVPCCVGNGVCGAGRIVSQYVRPFPNQVAQTPNKALHLTGRAVRVWKSTRLARPAPQVNSRVRPQRTSV